MEKINLQCNNLSLPEMVKHPQLAEHSIRGLTNPAIFDSAPYKEMGEWRVSRRGLGRSGGRKNLKNQTAAGWLAG